MNPIAGPPHSNVHATFTEIETIYRSYQVLLLNLRDIQKLHLHCDGSGGFRKNIGSVEIQVFPLIVYGVSPMPFE
jgi:hypothetical protein